MNNNRNDLISINQQDKYPYSINLYDAIPEFEIPIQCFEEYATRRINIYNTITKVKKENIINPINSNEVYRCVRENLPLFSNDYEIPQSLEIFKQQQIKIQENFKQRQIDHASYYILLLLCCRDVEMQEWLIKCEMSLFQLRLYNLEQKEKEEFIQSLHLKYQRATRQECQECRKYIYYTNSNEIYKVPFELVSELVRNRKIIIKKGTAFIKKNDIDIIVIDLFKKNIQKHLELVEKLVGLIQNDFDYVFSLLDTLRSKCHYQVTTHWKNSSILKENIQHTQVESLTKYFPPCMNFLFIKLKDHHHLKFAGRTQFGLFLKCGVGLNLFESLQFWEKAFQPRFNAIDFKREYAYNIRHNYGKEGSRIDYKSFDCEKIQNYNEPSNFDHYHGCPFKHFSTQNLIDYLNRYFDQYQSLSSSSLKPWNNPIQRANCIVTITNLVHQKKYCQACTYLLYFIQSNGHSMENYLNSDSTERRIYQPDNFFLYNYNHFVKS
ncbi:hypothetical protein BCR36DRAFT_351494 [Piromyces finnis]|uniref:DNA primase large subunit C-terminal domain-containing protein n=1 Tax=Piromyces finnis TaxID=1754191 RepID=A0A1Y1VAE7_9FUNG|nr:hypothetical protein BCR36DRAFT_351494 [Piromyces finnis]|eukprot:ORX51040.1 hypothetical protein BCR36DRAFT_351494 [Piromyces finnis]